MVQEPGLGGQLDPDLAGPRRSPKTPPSPGAGESPLGAVRVAPGPAGFFTLPQPQGVCVPNRVSGSLCQGLLHPLEFCLETEPTP